MVCERDPSSPNDPAEGRIALVRDGDWLTADGNDARRRRRHRDRRDDGARRGRVALPHGPLELLMTVAEEVGLEGANALDGSLLTGSTLINLDSEEDGVLTVGCAGSTDTWIRSTRRATRASRRVDPGGPAGGGLGGHSGSQIALGHANAIKVLGRVLRRRMRSSRSGSSRSTAARAVTRSRATPWRSARSRATRGRVRVAVESPTAPPCATPTRRPTREPP